MCGWRYTGVVIRADYRRFDGFDCPTGGVVDNLTGSVEFIRDLPLQASAGITRPNVLEWGPIGDENRTIKSIVSGDGAESQRIGDVSDVANRIIGVGSDRPSPLDLQDLALAGTAAKPLEVDTICRIR